MRAVEICLFFFIFLPARRVLALQHVHVHDMNMNMNLHVTVVGYEDFLL